MHRACQVVLERPRTHSHANRRQPLVGAPAQILRSRKKSATFARFGVIFLEPSQSSMNAKKLVVLTVAFGLFAISSANVHAQMHRQAGFAPQASTSRSFAGTRTGNWNGGNWGGNWHHHHHDNNTIFISSFGFPFFGFGYPYMDTDTAATIPTVATTPPLTTAVATTVGAITVAAATTTADITATVIRWRLLWSTRLF